MSTEKDEEDRRRGEALARSQTDPLFMQDFFLTSGHDKNTRNATASFVQLEGKQYAVTCGHVLDIIKKRRGKNPLERYPTLALVAGRAINLSFFTAQGMQYSFQAPEPDEREEPVDLAIADISARWKLLVDEKGKAAVDLDNYREPRWARAKMMVAAGYPDEHKENVSVEGGDMVGVPFAMIAAEKKGEISRDKEIAEMHSRLDKPHGWYFSGISGGLMYVVQDDIIIPAAIVFEGWPQSKHSKPHPTLTLNDIYVRGLTLTPKKFADWLTKAGLRKSKNSLKFGKR